MTPEIVFPAVNLRALGPILAVSVAALVVLLLDLLPRRKRI